MHDHHRRLPQPVCEKEEKEEGGKQLLPGERSGAAEEGESEETYLILCIDYFMNFSRPPTPIDASVNRYLSLKVLLT